MSTESDVSIYPSAKDSSAIKNSVDLISYPYNVVINTVPGMEQLLKE